MCYNLYEWDYFVFVYSPYLGSPFSVVPLSVLLTLSLWQIPSKVLCDAVGHQDLAPYLEEKGYIRMIQCFLWPELMIKQKKIPNDRREDEGNEIDPVYELFMPSHPQQQGNI